MSQKEETKEPRTEPIDPEKLQEFLCAFEESIRPGINEVQRRKAEAMVAAKSIIVTNPLYLPGIDPDPE